MRSLRAANAPPRSSFAGTGFLEIDGLLQWQPQEQQPTLHPDVLRLKREGVLIQVKIEVRGA